MATQRDPRQRLLGLTLMAASCFIWGLGPIWIRALLDYLPPIDIVLFRVGLGGLALTPFVLALDRRRLVWMLRRPSVWLGGLTMAGSMFCYAAAVRFISPAEVNLLFQANVLVAALLGRWLFHESIPPRRWLAFGAVVAGVAVVVLSGHSAAHASSGVSPVVARIAGVLLGLAAGASVSVVQACLRDVSTHGVGLPALVPMHAAAVLAYATATGFRISFLQPPDARFWVNVLLLGLLASGLASVLISMAVPRISLAQVGVTGSTQPVTTMAAQAVTGLTPSPTTLAGGALVVGGVIYSALLEKDVKDTRHESLVPPLVE